MESSGFYEDVFRVPLLGKARDERGLLICVACGWAWLTIDTSKFYYGLLEDRMKQL